MELRRPSVGGDVGDWGPERAALLIAAAAAAGRSLITSSRKGSARMAVRRSPGGGGGAPAVASWGCVAAVYEWRCVCHDNDVCVSKYVICVFKCVLCAHKCILFASVCARAKQHTATVCDVSCLPAECPCSVSRRTIWTCRCTIQAERQRGTPGVCKCSKAVSW